MTRCSAAAVPPLLLAALLAGCGLFHRRAPAVVTQPHYQLGGPYQAGSVWFYPEERQGGIETGLATIEPSAPPRLTADGEAFDPDALAGAHQTLQLPAIVRLTDLRTGRATTIRLNDRGPASPARVVAVTPRVAALLQLAEADPVRLEVLPEPTRVAAEGVGGGPLLAIAAAPLDAVAAESLPPPGDGAAHPAAPLAAAPTAAPAAAPPRPDHAPAIVPPLDGGVTQAPVAPVRLMLHLGDFTTARPAAMQAAAVAGAAVSLSRAGRSTAYSVDAGPFADAAAAEAALDRALGAGVTDARIVVR